MNKQHALLVGAMDGNRISIQVRVNEWPKTTLEKADNLKEGEFLNEPLFNYPEPIFNVEEFVVDLPKDAASVAIYVKELSDK